MKRYSRNIPQLNCCLVYNKLKSMKLVVTGTRGIPNVMGGVETHCEELFPHNADYDCAIISMI